MESLQQVGIMSEPDSGRWCEPSAMKHLSEQILGYTRREVKGRTERPPQISWNRGMWSLGFSVCVVGGAQVFVGPLWRWTGDGDLLSDPLTPGRTGRVGDPHSIPTPPCHRPLTPNSPPTLLLHF